MKPGREVLDPQGRVVTVLRCWTEAGTRWVEVRLGGSYGATARYTESMLRPVP